MASINQDILFNVTGQTIWYDVPEGRPSGTPTLGVFAMSTGDDGTAQVATGAASVEANPDTTFDANSGVSSADQTLANLTATTGMAIGRRYLATNALGETEWIEVAGITAAASAQATSAMVNDYVATDTLEGTRISAAIDSTWVAASGNITDNLDPNPGYRVRWSYVVGGVTYIKDSYFDLVRYIGTHNVNAADMRAMVPNWDTRLPTYHREDSGARLVDEAYAQVKWDMHRSGLADEVIRNRPAIDRLVMHKAWVLLERQGGDEFARVDSLETYQAMLDGLIRVVRKVPVSTDGSGAGQDSVAHAIWSK